ncbi:MAG: DNA polymerase III subunit alpha [Blastocatellia bacterium]|nr:DNA polymerase III subunit alpha [Blastocatellia bacterium]
MTTPPFDPKDFVHLHLHSDYSLLQSTIQLNPLAEKLVEFGMKACAITDYGNMYGAIGFYRTMKSNGIKPILGYEAFVAAGSRLDHTSAVAAGEKAFYSLVLLAKDHDGYQNLVYISSKAFTEGFHHKPRVDNELLAAKPGGLIALSGGNNGEINHFLNNGDRERALSAAKRYAEIFGIDNFFVEVQDLDERSAETNKNLREIAQEAGVGLVATNDPHYLVNDDALAHEVLTCIGEGRTLSEASRSNVKLNRHVRSGGEMLAVFGAEYPDALANTAKIADMCNLALAVGDAELTLPSFPIDPNSGCTTLDGYFEKVVRDGLEERKRSVLQPMFEAGVLKYPMNAYNDRLQLEIDVIEGMGYSGYFLIVWEFIKYAIDQGIPVGPGRGSAAGSLVAYSLGITGIDPLQYDLFFERFLNPERVSMPDIDIDFCIRGRSDVINHVAELYGRESVCQIITFGTMASRAAIKDVGRAMNMPYGDVEKIAKLIPPPYRGRNISIDQALKEVPELSSARASSPVVDELISLALRVEGCSRHTSVHAAGVVISPKPLCEIVPVAISAKNEYTSQYPMGDLEKVGMLKMDFLGLTTLTIIHDCLANLKEKADVEIDWSIVPLNDEKTMQLFSQGRTDAVFQFESSGMQDICRQLRPKELEDLSALNALYRPGPIDGGMIDDFIQRHRGEKAVAYIVPEMEDILKNTYGVLVYQEQIMQIAQKLAGYTLGEADLMRRAMGKKDKAQMVPHEEKFVAGAIERGIGKKQAVEIFALMAKFADYGFNRSHSIAYAYLAFQTAYLKAHYPEYFYSAVLSHEADDSAKVYKYSNELRALGLQLLPPDINESDEGFTPSTNAVRFGLSAIKGMGTAAARAIIEARSKQRFTSLYDFVSRIDQGAINRRSLESLITAGAFDTLAPDGVTNNQWRAKLFAAIDAALSYAQNAWTDHVRGQSGLFGTTQEAESGGEDLLPDVKPWSQSDVSRLEKAAIGFYLSAHPLDDYVETLNSLRIRNMADIENIKPGDTLMVAGIVSAAQVRYSKKGNRFCIFRLEDQSTGMKCLVWAEAYGKYAASLKDDEMIIVEGKVEAVEGNETTLIVSALRTLKDTVSRNARSLTITLPTKPIDEEYLQDIYSVLSDTQGRCDVRLQFSIDGLDLLLESGPIRVQGSHSLETQLVARGCQIEWNL